MTRQLAYLCYRHWFIIGLQVKGVDVTNERIGCFNVVAATAATFAIFAVALSFAGGKSQVGLH